MPLNFSDIYVKYEGHPRYNDKKIVENDLIEVMVQKLEMILFSNKGSLFGDPGMGCDLEYYLWSTKVPDTEIRNNITEQISTYIPELNEVGYTLDLKLYEGEYRDILYLNFTIKGYNYYMVMS